MQTIHIHDKKFSLSITEEEIQAAVRRVGEEIGRAHV